VVWRLGSRPRLGPGLDAGEPEHLGRGLLQAHGPAQLRLEADVGGISVTLSRHNLWILLIVAAPCESPSAEEAEGQEEGGEEADHPEYRQGGWNTVGGHEWDDDDENPGDEEDDTEADDDTSTSLLLDLGSR